jgi:hypothetical protein
MQLSGRKEGREKKHVYQQHSNNIHQLHTTLTPLPKDPF